MSHQPGSIRIKGRSPFAGMYLPHAMSRFDKTDFYDGSAIVEAVRRAEVELGAKGLLDKQGTESAQRIAENLANPPQVDIELEFSGQPPDGTVIIRHKSGRSHTIKLKMEKVGDSLKVEMFKAIDAMIIQMISGGGGAGKIG